MAVRARIVNDAIRTDDVLHDVGDDGSGAVILFLGTVRDHAEGRPVARLKYEAYEPMAQSVLQEILEDARDRGGVEHVSAVHRVGELEIGEISVAIAVSSAHRASAYEASRFVIEEVKRRLPVWKKERFADGDEAWVAGADPVGSDSEGPGGKASPKGGSL